MVDGHGRSLVLEGEVDGIIALGGPLLVADQSGRFNDRDLGGDNEFWTCTDSMIIESARRIRAPSTLAA
jgi:hypothetical protein